MRRTAILLCACAVWPAMAACDPTVFDTIESDAPVVIIRSPGGTSGAFGSVLVGYEAEIRTMPVSRIAVAGGLQGGASSSFHVYFGFDGDGPDAVPRFDGTGVFDGCEDNECDPGVGASLAAFPEWNASSGAVFHGCVAAPGSSGGINIRCEDQAGIYQNVMGPPDERFGASAAGISWPQHRAGVALIGAPGALAGDGALYRLPNGGAPPIRVNLDAAMIPAGSAIGTEVAVHPLSERAIVFATRAASTTVERVIVGTLDVDDASVVSVTVQGCLEGPRGYGGALAWGDLDGDGVADLAIGRSDDATDPRIDVFDGNDFSAATDCAAGSTQPTAATTITCTDVVPADGPFACPAPGSASGLGFGSALAIGDLDADGAGDLVIGVPGAAPKGADSGALIVAAGSSTGLAEFGREHAVLTYSSQDAGDRLGTEVTTLRGRDRDEIVAGAPGGSEIAIFLCSGISGDRPEDFENGDRTCL